MNTVDAATAFDAIREATEFDDVLATCGQLEGMLARLRRQRLLPETEYAAYTRQIDLVRDRLSEQQARRAARPAGVRLAS